MRRVVFGIVDVLHSGHVTIDGRDDSNSIGELAFWIVSEATDDRFGYSASVMCWVSDLLGGGLQGNTHVSNSYALHRSFPFSTFYVFIYLSLYRD